MADKKKEKNKGGISEVDKSYIAGIIDGEGCIYLGFNKTINSTRGSFTAGITVEMACKSVPEWIFKRVGGTLSSRQRPHSDKIMWQWKISGGSSREFLKDIKHYLVEKQKEAELYLDFGKNITTCGRVEISDEERDRRLNLIQEMKLSRKKQYE